MRRWLAQLDHILRGEVTRPSELKDGTIRFPVAGLLLVLLVLGLVYGFCMGWYAVANHETPNYKQLLASTFKVPALFALTVVVTFPSLYVFNALVGSRLNIAAVFRLLVAALAVTLAVLASLGPITAFFSITTTSYSFMVLMNVAIFAVSGTLGLGFLLQTLNRLTAQSYGERPPRPRDEFAAEVEAGSVAPSEVDAESLSDDAQPVRAELAERPSLPEGMGADPLESHVRTVFRVWVLVFVLVGAQMAWVLRPFIGDPERPFIWFGARESNFIEAVIESFKSLLL